MQKWIAIFVILLGPAAALRAQVAPAATGSVVNGQLNYSLRYSEIEDHYSSGNLSGQRAVASGSLGYGNESERTPFSLNFQGGYGWIVSGADYGAGFFEESQISQGLKGADWGLTLANSNDYFPQSPITSGGTGAPITGSAPPPTQSVFTATAVLLNNSSSAVFEHRLGTGTTMNLKGMYDFMTFPDGGGTGNNTLTGNAGVSERLDARNTLSETYAYEQYAYSGAQLNITTNSGLFGYQRMWNRKLTTSVAAGPEWVASSQANLISNALHLSAQASLSYVLHRGTATLSYMQGTNSGAGYIYGGGIKMASASYAIQFRNRTSLQAAAGWYQTAGLTTSGTIDSEFGSAQFAKQIGRHFSLFADFMMADQSSNIAAPASILSASWQRISGGISYTPTGVHF